MASSTIVRISAKAAEAIKARAERNSRTQVAEMDLVIEAGIAALEAAEKRRSSRRAG